MAKSRVPYVSLLSVLVVTTAAVGFDLAWRGLHRFPSESVQYVNGGDPARGREHVVRYGCGSCHVVPGVPRATGRVGPRLTGFKEQIYIAGVLPNLPEDLASWVENPRRIDPQTAMPNLGVTPEEAKDIAAYLYSTP